jgi:hypothetical protein
MAVILARRDHVVPAGTLAAIGAILIAVGALKPTWLRGLSPVWWRFARALGYVNARVLLTILFFAALVPAGFLRRATGRDPLGRRRDKWRGWSARPARYADPKHYNRMF